MTNQWIKVTDRKPNKDVRVLVYLGKTNSYCSDMTTAYYDGRERWVGACYKMITHWMPLPQPPDKWQREVNINKSIWRRKK